jgi:hypothetical protein
MKFYQKWFVFNTWVRVRLFPPVHDPFPGDPAYGITKAPEADPPVLCSIFHAV